MIFYCFDVVINILDAITYKVRNYLFIRFLKIINNLSSLSGNWNDTLDVGRQRQSLWIT